MSSMSRPSRVIWTAISACARLIGAVGSVPPSTKAEMTNLLKAGIEVFLVFEYTGRDCDRGYAGGASDAKEVQRQATALAVPSAVVYFARPTTTRRLATKQGSTLTSTAPRL